MYLPEYQKPNPANLSYIAPAIVAGAISVAQKLGPVVAKWLGPGKSPWRDAPEAQREQWVRDASTQLFPSVTSKDALVKAVYDALNQAKVFEGRGEVFETFASNWPGNLVRAMYDKLDQQKATMTATVEAGKAKKRNYYIIGGIGAVVFIGVLIFVLKWKR